MDISLQLYSLKEDEQENFSRALEMTARAGYQGVEFAGYFGHSPERLKALLAKYNLKAVSTHAGIQRFREAFEEELDYAKTLGYSLIVCPGIGCETREGTVEDAMFLESCAREAEKAGVTVGYHNHSHEFKQFGGDYALDILLQNAPHVKLELDVCWAANAGVDPVAYLTPWVKAGRVCAIHAKELGEGKKVDCYIGEGIVDFRGLAKLCPPDRFAWIVEQEDYHTGRLEGITACYNALRKIFESV